MMHSWISAYLPPAPLSVGAAIGWRCGWLVGRCLLQAGVKDTPTSFVFTDAQVVMESFLEDVNNILNAGDVPNLC